jgi:hypothetical protein
MGIRVTVLGNQTIFIDSFFDGWATWVVLPEIICVLLQILVRLRDFPLIVSVLHEFPGVHLKIILEGGCHSANREIG